MAAPLEQRRGIGVVLALRRWEPEGFKRMRRTPPVSASERDRRKVRFKAK